ncbi:12335_t:CDS:2 [Acaulospora colombiana]|uniref:12335_t:CDS:1 n=1 Tax=Acaulospora colombiana TaxID=27376 RepID=A0ACA9L017_9GLOM|nr:12335_t:CDS:2 [Acaulospora colombiana]
MLAPQLSTSEAVTSSFTDTNSSNTEVISLWTDEAIEEAKTRPSSPLTINNDIKDVNPEAEQAKLIELCRDLDNCERTSRAIVD